MINRSSERSKVTMAALEGTQRHLKSLDEIPALVSGYRLMGDPTRFKILLCLAHARELCVSDIADILKMDTSAISHQLRKLKDGGLVKNNREGATIYYAIEKEVVREVIATARSLLL
ncbi:ArsR/SmtB family transcription factor [Candidatus Neomarinimicrobiota bacterium]